MLKIIDLERGNIGSVIKALKFLGAEFELVTTPEKLSNASKIILPGVGSFTDASKKLMKSGFKEKLDHLVLQDRIPILGICVGMQLLASDGDEGGGAAGLGYIAASVKKLNSFDNSLNIPHMGWNDIQTKGHPLLDNIPDNSCFYFVHSYAMKIRDSFVDIAYTDYGEDVVAYVKKDNIYGAQFHPEKSQLVGLQFLRNFIEKC